jgi:hypothetical protein
MQPISDKLLAQAEKLLNLDSESLRALEDKVHACLSFYTHSP